MKFAIGPGLTCDLSRLVDTRLLVQANSGGGKSWVLRRLLEQTHGGVQHLVIDPEGEFASLRERFDYVHAAKSGADTAADPRAAALLAERLLELNVSAVLDIYELKAHERVRFVKLFLDALVNAPKKLWHPALVVLDEAHVYCPEKGEAESAGAVIDLATRGRKRGFAIVLATQRLAKLHKDAAAECNNKLIGRTTLDVDVKRAANELGIREGDARLVLRELQPGEFFGYGPAFEGRANEYGVIKARAGEIQTTHPKAGAHRKFEAPPPTSAIAKLLPSLKDLPAESEQRAQSLADLKRELADTRRKLTEAQKAAPAAEWKVVEKFALKDGQLARAEKIIETIHGTLERVNALRGQLEDYRAKLFEAVEPIAAAIAQTRSPQPIQPPTTTHRASPHGRRAEPAESARRPAPVVSGNGDLSGPEMKILTSVAELEALQLYPADKLQVALLAGYTNVRSGGFSEPVGRLVTNGYLASPQPGVLTITDAGVQAVGHIEPPQTAEEMQTRVMDKLTGPERKLLSVLIAHYPQAITKDALAQECNYTNIRSGGFSEPLGRLNRLGLVQADRGQVAAAPVLFLER